MSGVIFLKVSLFLIIDDNTTIGSKCKISNYILSTFLDPIQEQDYMVLMKYAMITCILLTLLLPYVICPLMWHYGLKSPSNSIIHFLPL